MVQAFRTSTCRACSIGSTRWMRRAPAPRCRPAAASASRSCGRSSSGTADPSPPGTRPRGEPCSSFGSRRRENSVPSVQSPITNLQSTNQQSAIDNQQFAFPCHTLVTALPRRGHIDHVFITNVGGGHHRLPRLSFDELRQANTRRKDGPSGRSRGTPIVGSTASLADCADPCVCGSRPDRFRYTHPGADRDRSRPGALCSGAARPRTRSAHIADWGQTPVGPLHTAVPLVGRRRQRASSHCAKRSGATRVV